MECTLGTNSSLRLLNLFPEKPLAVVALAVGPQRFSKTEKGWLNRIWSDRGWMDRS